MLTHPGPQHPFEHVQKMVWRAVGATVNGVRRTASRRLRSDREAAQAALTTRREVIRFPFRTVMWIKKCGMVTQALSKLVKGRTRYPLTTGGYSMA